MGEGAAVGVFSLVQGEIERRVRNVELGVSRTHFHRLHSKETAIEREALRQVSHENRHVSLGQRSRLI
jgi:hypothetical protein